MVDITKFVPEGVIPSSSLKLSQQVKKIKDATSTGLELDASTLAATLKSEVGVLDTDFRALVPPIPTLPSLNFQAELQSLMSLGANTPDGIAKLSSMKSKFGAGMPDIDAIKDLGTSNMASKIDGIVGQIPDFELPTGGATELLQSGQLQGLLDAASNADLGSITEGLNPISSGIPNFQLPAGATEAIQKAQSVVLPTIAPIAEELSTFNIADSPMNEVTGEVGDLVAAAVERISGEGKYTFPNPEINLVFPDKLKDLSGQLGSITESVETSLPENISSADRDAIKEKLAVVKKQVLSSDVPVESGPMLSNLEESLGGLKTQLGESGISGTDGIMDNFNNVKTGLTPPTTEIEQTVQSATEPEKEYSQGEKDALLKQSYPSDYMIMRELQRLNRVKVTDERGKKGVLKCWVYRGTNYIYIDPEDVKYGDRVLTDRRSGFIGTYTGT